MSGSAIVMFIVAITILWGGLITSILYLRSHSEVTEGPYAVDPDESPETDPDPGA